MKYIGRERLSVEELFKKVRKTVYNLSGGKQTTWEHTSLIGDFYFNTGQLVHSLSIPYSEDVVKDINYSGSDEFAKLIGDIKSYDWNIQNPAIIKILKIVTSNLDKNQQFILGRNLLQASGAAREAQNFMKSLPINLKRFLTNDGNNDLLNGILFEIYFDPHSNFRKDKTKKHNFDEIILLRKNPLFRKSFEFISNLLLSTDYPLIYIPQNKDEIFDIDVVANNEKISNAIGIETEYQIISKITCNSVDILNEVSNYDIYYKNELGLKVILGNFLSAPIDLIQINSNIILKKIAISKGLEEDDLIKW